MSHLTSPKLTKLMTAVLLFHLLDDFVGFVTRLLESRDV